MELTQERLKELFHYDPETGVFTWIAPSTNRIKPGRTAGAVTHQGYIEIQINGRKCGAHRLAWLYVNGKFPEHQIDHIDGNRTNNRINNLRDIPQEGNKQNRRFLSDRNTSGFLGVTFQKDIQKWVAGLSLNGKHTHLGVFKAPEEAHAAYLKAKRDLHPFCTI